MLCLGDVLPRCMSHSVLYGSNRFAADIFSAILVTKVDSRMFRRRFSCLKLLPRAQLDPHKFVVTGCVRICFMVCFSNVAVA